MRRRQNFRQQIRVEESFDTPQDKEALHLWSPTIVIVALLFAGMYAWTTWILFDRNNATTMQSFALLGQANLIEAQLGSIDLSQYVGGSTLVESGTCRIQGPSLDSLVNYTYYSYVVFNITRYYAEFEGNVAGITADPISTNPVCPAGVQTFSSLIRIYDCTVDPGRDLTVPSQINSNVDYIRVLSVFPSTELSKIAFSGANAIISGEYSANGPCSPQTYQVIPRTLSGLFIDGFQFQMVFFSNDSGPTYSLSLQNVRIPIPVATHISKKK